MTTLTKTKTPARNAVQRGGKRSGAGRPHGSGKYGEPTKAIRIPQSLVDKLQQILVNYDNESSPLKWLSLYQSASSKAPRRPIPLFEHKIPAGFPSPADDHMEMRLDLNEYLIPNPVSTFFVRVEGESMIDAGIRPNDILIVDLSIEPCDGHIVIALINGEFTVKRLKIGTKKQITLVPENESFAPLVIKDGMDFKIWGVVTNVIHSLVKKST